MHAKPWVRKIKTIEIESAFGSPTLEPDQSNGPKNRLQFAERRQPKFSAGESCAFRHGARKESADEFR
jgi:hypothetical protein